MSPKLASRDDLKVAAIRAITYKSSLALDVADNHGQIYSNVAHMNWFLLQVMQEIANRNPSYQHLVNSVYPNETESQL